MQQISSSPIPDLDAKIKYCMRLCVTLYQSVFIVTPPPLQVMTWNLRWPIPISDCILNEEDSDLEKKKQIVEKRHRYVKRKIFRKFRIGKIATQQYKYYLSSYG